MRYIGIDLHKRVIQAHLIAEDLTRQDVRFDLTRETLIAFAAKHLGPDCELALEATTNTWEVVDILTPFCAKVVVSNPMATKAIAFSKIKTDKVDARVLADLLRCDFLPTVFTPDAETRSQRSIAARRSALTRQSISLKNRAQSVLHQRLIPAPADLFGTKGRTWLAAVQVPEIDRMELDTITRMLDLVQLEQDCIALRLDQYAHENEDIKRLITLPGIDVTTAHAMLASIGPIERFAADYKLTAYWGLVPSVSQSADKTYMGKITKQGNKNVRWLLIQAAQHAAKHPGPLGYQFARLEKKKGHNVAVVAIARKLAEIAWHLLTKKDVYRYALPATVEAKLQRIRVNATGEKKKTGPKKGSAKTAAGTPRTREVKALNQVLEAEGLPTPSPAPAAEARVLMQMKLTAFAKGLHLAARKSSVRIPRASAQAANPLDDAR